MKRKNYTVTVTHANSGVQSVKHSWNTARREIPKLIKNVMLGDTEIATLEKGDYKHSPDGDLWFGREIWKSNWGREFIATIEKEQDHEI